MSNISDLCKEPLKYDAVIYVLQTTYDEFLEYKSLTFNILINMNKTEMELFWTQYEIYIFGLLSYIDCINMPKEKSKINSKINMDYNNGVNICDESYLHHKHLIGGIHLYFWTSITQKQHIQKILIQPKLELK